MTAVSGSVFTAAQYNQSVRDNLNETAPAKVTAAGQILVGLTANSIVARTPTEAGVATSENTGSTTFTNLTTLGPVVTVTTGAQAIVLMRSSLINTAAVNTYVGFTVSGASTIAASTATAMAGATTTGLRIGMPVWVSGLTPGVNTFTMQYQVASGTGSFQDRHLAVIPL
jgi:hypothetical protein